MGATGRSSRTLSVSEWTLSAPSAADAIDRVAAAGYSSIELAATPELDVRAARERLDAHGITVSSLCWMGLGYPERDCAHSSQLIRRRAGDYLRASLEQADAVGAPVLVLVPTFRVAPDPSGREAELDRAVETIAAGARAAGRGPVIALEALNRYETHLLRTLDDAEQLRELIDLPNVELMADVFHMNIEEDSIPAALRRHARHIVHVHLADNQRREPGSGQLDFAAVFAALDASDYTGAMAMEFIPATDAAIRAGREWVQAQL